MSKHTPAPLDHRPTSSETAAFNAALMEAAPDLLVWTEGLYSILKLSNVALSDELKVRVESLIKQAKGEASREES